MRGGRRLGLALAALALLLSSPAIVASVQDASCRYSVAREGVPLPDLVGMALPQAEAALTATRPCLRLQVTAVRDSPEGVVVEQDPAWPSTTVDHVVDVVVANGHAVPTERGAGRVTVDYLLTAVPMEGGSIRYVVLTVDGSVLARGQRTLRDQGDHPLPLFSTRLPAGSHELHIEVIACDERHCPEPDDRRLERCHPGLDVAEDGHSRHVAVVGVGCELRSPT